MDYMEIAPLITPPMQTGKRLTTAGHMLRLMLLKLSRINNWKADPRLRDDQSVELNPGHMLLTRVERNALG